VFIIVLSKLRARVIKMHG